MTILWLSYFVAEERYKWTGVRVVNLNTENSTWITAVCTSRQQNWKWGNFTLLFTRTARNCPKVLAARAARLLFVTRPIKVLICCVLITVPVVDAKAFLITVSVEIVESLSNPWRRQQKPHKFAYLKMKNSIFARFARAFFIFWHFEDVFVLSTTWNDLFCSCVDDVSIWWEMFNFVFLYPKRWFQFNSGIVRTHFSSIMTLNNWKIQKREVTFSDDVH